MMTPFKFTFFAVTFSHLLLFNQNFADNRGYIVQKRVGKGKVICSLPV